MVDQLDTTGSEGGDTQPDPDYNEAAYLAAFPRIAEQIRNGALKSGLDHYTRRGAAEGRLAQPRYKKALAEQALLSRLAAPPPVKPAPSLPGDSAPPVHPAQPAHATPLAQAALGYVPSGTDAMMLTRDGTCLAIGWVDDRAIALRGVAVAFPDGRPPTGGVFARCRRADAEAITGCPPGHLLGFFALVELGPDQLPPPGATLVLDCAGHMVSHTPRLNLVDAATLRDAAFEYLHAAAYAGNPAVDSFRQLELGIGHGLLRLNATLCARITAGAHVERHGNHARAFCASIVVCLFGKPEYLFLQAALFSAAPGAGDYEYVYVSNSPELTEQLQREARLAARLYGLALTMIYLPGNAGFGAANNLAVSHAASPRVLILNPDVFPRDPAWAVRHAALVDGLPAEETRLFGAPLFYDDGSLMHGGMFFEADVGLSARPDCIERVELLRVEHYGKGAPPDTAEFLRSRPVPAVTGAFMSADRAWFERLGGFSEEYVYGHYEDADLCLKSWQAGGAVWLHDFPLWHLEGKGSTRRPAHEGGSVINRWHFTRVWAEVVRDGFAGPNPARVAAFDGLRTDAPPASAARGPRR